MVILYVIIIFIIYGNNQSGQTINGESILRPYKVYSALVTQRGGSNPLSTISGPLTIGVTYNISQLNGQDDFTNVGTPINEINVIFVATGTTPNNWSSESILLYDTGVPTVKVLENTIGNFYFTYDSVGRYGCISVDALLTVGKIFVNVPIVGSSDQNSIIPITLIDLTDNGTQFYFTSVPFGDTIPSDGLLWNTPIEIRVYN